MERSHYGPLGDMHKLDLRVIVLRQGEYAWQPVQRISRVVSNIYDSLKVALRQFRLGDPRANDQDGTHHIAENFLNSRVQAGGSWVLNLSAEYHQVELSSFDNFADGTTRDRTRQRDL